LRSSTFCRKAESRDSLRREGPAWQNLDVAETIRDGKAGFALASVVDQGPGGVVIHRFGRMAMAHPKPRQHATARMAWEFQALRIRIGLLDTETGNAIRSVISAVLI